MIYCSLLWKTWVLRGKIFYPVLLEKTQGVRTTSPKYILKKIQIWVLELWMASLKGGLRVCQIVNGANKKPSFSNNWSFDIVPTFMIKSLTSERVCIYYVAPKKQKQTLLEDCFFFYYLKRDIYCRTMSYIFIYISWFHNLTVQYTRTCKKTLNTANYYNSSKLLKVYLNLCLVM